MQVVMKWLASNISWIAPSIATIIAVLFGDRLRRRRRECGALVKFEAGISKYILPRIKINNTDGRCIREFHAIRYKVKVELARDNAP